MWDFPGLTMVAGPLTTALENLVKSRPGTIVLNGIPVLTFCFRRWHSPQDVGGGPFLTTFMATLALILPSSSVYYNEEIARRLRC